MDPFQLLLRRSSTLASSSLGRSMARAFGEEHEPVDAAAQSKDESLPVGGSRTMEQEVLCEAAAIRRTVRASHGPLPELYDGLDGLHAAAVERFGVSSSSSSGGASSSASGLLPMARSPGHAARRSAALIKLEAAAASAAIDQALQARKLRAMYAQSAVDRRARAQLLAERGHRAEAEEERALAALDERQARDPRRHDERPLAPPALNPLATSARSLAAPPPRLLPPPPPSLDRAAPYRRGRARVAASAASSSTLALVTPPSSAPPSLALAARPLPSAFAALAAAFPSAFPPGLAPGVVRKRVASVQAAGRRVRTLPLACAARVLGTPLAQLAARPRSAVDADLVQHFATWSAGRINSAFCDLQRLHRFAISRGEVLDADTVVNAAAIAAFIAHVDAQARAAYAARAARPRRPRGRHACCW